MSKKEAVTIDMSGLKIKSEDEQIEDFLQKALKGADAEGKVVTVRLHERINNGLVRGRIRADLSKADSVGFVGV